MQTSENAGLVLFAFHRSLSLDLGIHNMTIVLFNHAGKLTKQTKIEFFQDCSAGTKKLMKLVQSGVWLVHGDAADSDSDFEGQALMCVVTRSRLLFVSQTPCFLFFSAQPLLHSSYLRVCFHVGGTQVTPRSEFRQGVVRIIDTRFSWDTARRPHRHAGRHVLFSSSSCIFGRIVLDWRIYIHHRFIS